jgi:hypothetical protein
MEAYAYQAIMHSLNTILVGWIGQSLYEGPVTSTTTIMSTVLANTPELAGVISSDSQSMVNPNNTQSKSNSTSNLSLPLAIEELSKNITISFFSSNLYL